MNITDRELLVRHETRESWYLWTGLPVLPIPSRIVLIKVTIASQNILTITLTQFFILFLWSGVLDKKWYLKEKTRIRQPRSKLTPSVNRTCHPSVSTKTRSCVICANFKASLLFVISILVPLFVFLYWHYTLRSWPRIGHQNVIA